MENGFRVSGAIAPGERISGAGIDIEIPPELRGCADTTHAPIRCWGFLETSLDCNSTNDFGDIVLYWGSVESCKYAT
jgi:hypothetical protein